MRDQVDAVSLGDQREGAFQKLTELLLLQQRAQTGNVRLHKLVQHRAGVFGVLTAEQAKTLGVVRHGGGEPAPKHALHLTVTREAQDLSKADQA